MEQVLIDELGINAEHAILIDSLKEPQRSLKIEELREWKIIKKLEF